MCEEKNTILHKFSSRLCHDFSSWDDGGSRSIQLRTTDLDISMAAGFYSSRFKNKLRPNELWSWLDYTRSVHTAVCDCGLSGASVKLWVWDTASFLLLFFISRTHWKKYCLRWESNLKVLEFLKQDRQYNKNVFTYLAYWKVNLSYFKQIKACSVGDLIQKEF